MSAITTYNCNLCRMKLEIPQLLCWYFKTGTSYQLTRDVKQSDIHICKSCASQLKTQLNEIQNEDL